MTETHPLPVERQPESMFTCEYILAFRGLPVEIRATEDIDEETARAILMFAQRHCRHCRHCRHGRLWMIECKITGPIIELWLMTDSKESYMRDCVPRIVAQYGRKR